MTTTGKVQRNVLREREEDRARQRSADGAPTPSRWPAGASRLHVADAK